MPATRSNSTARGSTAKKSQHPTKAKSKKGKKNLTSGKPSIPYGYTFMNRKIFVSKMAQIEIAELLDQADNRDPDNFNMYIYNMFYKYALFEMIDPMISKLRLLVTKKKWDEAWAHLEVLTVFQEFRDSWAHGCDWQRAQHTDEVYGACVVAIVRALDKDGHLTVERIPNLEHILKLIANWGDSIIGQFPSSESPYAIVCKGIGERLFKKKTKNEEEREKAMLEEWILSLDKALRPRSERESLRKKKKTKKINHGIPLLGMRMSIIRTKG